MINKLFNWVGGGFFRTLGRFLAFIALGFLASVIISKNDIKWTDLLGIETVKALTLTQEVELKETTWITQQSQGNWVDTWEKYRATVAPSTNMQYVNFEFNQDASVIANRDFLEIPFILSRPSQYEDTENQIIACYDYGHYTNASGQEHWICDSWQNNITGQIYESNFDKLSFFVLVIYTDSTYSSCTIQDNNIICPLKQKKPRSIYFYFDYRNENPYSVRLYIDRFWKWYISASPTSAIENQTQQQQQQHNETISTITDSNTTEATSEANNFFSNFQDTDNGGISSIITAPLSAISGLVSATCHQIVLPIPYLDNKQLVLPCMSAIYTEHFGAFFTIYQTIIFGAIAYRMLVSIFMMIQGFKNPDDDKIEVVDL